MNKSQLKTYAPKARREFIQMVRQRADVLGLTKAEIQKPEVQGDVAVIEGRPYPRHYAELHTRIAKKIKAEGLDQFLDRTAYSWFNRFAALRYMEVNGYLSHPFRVLSNRDAGKNEPEILEHAAEVQLAGLDRDKAIELKLAGDRDAELYKLLLIAQCNELHSAMPFLFERVNDESELLLSENLLRTDSVVRKMVSEIDEENWQQVEIIGWLYQFYISEKKDEVIGKTVKSEDIPAATQLFTPNWIVKYMTQNSLGRLWLEANPQSDLKTKAPMEFYIEPAEDNPKVDRDQINPEEITVLDPACGSGHILVEAYDLLKAIYTERGYSSRDIPRLILEKNLFGLDIDERAAQLSNFTLLMKARGDDPRIFEQNAVPNILTIPDSSTLEYKPSDIAEMFLHGGTNIDSISTPIRDPNLLFTEMETQPSLTIQNSPPYEGGVAAALGGRGGSLPVTETNITDLLELFAQGNTLGSLIRIPDGFEKVIDNIETSITAKFASSDMMEQIAARQLVPFVRAAKMLVGKYDCVVANPPYMGTKGMESNLKEHLRVHYAQAKTDTFAAFIVRSFELCGPQAFLGFVTPMNWMFLSTFKPLRESLLRESEIESLVQLEFNAFEPAMVSVCAFTLRKPAAESRIGTFVRLSDFKGVHVQALRTLEAINNPYVKWRYESRTDTFRRIPEKVIAYWLSEPAILAFERFPLLEEIATPKQGLATTDNAQFVRLWCELDHSSIKFGCPSRQEAAVSGFKWFPYNKGGDYRRWFGNNDYVVNWESDGVEIKNNVIRKYPYLNGNPDFVTKNQDAYFKEGITWTYISAAYFGVRYSPSGFIFDVAGSSIFPETGDLKTVLAFMCSKVADYYIKAINPTMNIQAGNVGKLPLNTEFLHISSESISRLTDNLCEIARADWDSFETSWDFKAFPILDLRSAMGKPPTDSVEECWNRWNELAEERIWRMQELETENNRLFIDAYGLQDELSPEVPRDQITLARADKEKDTRRLLSYFIGCLMGRYSLDEPGLIYADAGNVGFDASRYKAFPCDEDGIVPVTDMEWFPQEAARQFEAFIKVAWGEQRLAENLRWIAEQLSPKAGEEPIDTIRRYFSSSFFKDHMQTYKKRPIYWLFSSGKQKAFECLVYLHRYNESTLPRIRHEYVLPLMSKLEAQIETNAGLIETSTSVSQKNKLNKQMEILKKKQIELAQFDEKLRHYADMRIILDLDDGVKVNYGKFGDLLAEVKAITGTKD